MKWQLDTRSLALGTVLGVGLSMLVAAARNELAGPVGRYQVCCGQNSAYLVDTVTGQVWLNSEREFRAPKLRAEPLPESPAAVKPPVPRTPAVEAPRVEVPGTEPRPKAGPSGFTGKWVLTHPTEGQLGIQIEPDGRATLTEGDKTWEGKWRVEGDQITITTEGETVTAQLDDQGRLLVREGSSDPVPFQRAE